MTDMVVQKNIAALVHAAVSVAPQSSGAATVNGTAIDRALHGDAACCVLFTAVGDVTGAPTTTSVVSKIQDSADSATWADYEPDGSNVATGATLTAANTSDGTGVDLSSARRYVRAVTTVAFTGGTSPAALIAASLILAGEDRLAAS